MPKKDSSLSRTLRTGAFVALGIVIFFGALFVLGARKQLFENRVKIYALYNDVAGLQEGAFVRIAGINVGTVSRISLPDSVGVVRTEFNVRGDALSQIRTDSRAVIGTEGLIGARIVLITPGSFSEQQIAPGDTISGQSPISLHEFQEDIDEALDNLPELMLNVGVTLASLRSIAEKIDHGKGTVGKLVNESALYDTVLSTADYVRDAAQGANKVLRTVQTEASILSEQYGALAESLQTATSGLRIATTKVTDLITTVQDGSGTLGRLITDDSLYVVMTRMAASGDTMVVEASAAIRQIAQASHTVAEAAHQASLTINQISDKLQRGEGTIGKLLSDDTTYVRLNRILQHLQIASEKAAVNMEAIRTNWLFRGYFDEQGYWDTIDRQVELQEQRSIRLREWELRLVRLQDELEALERRIEEERLRPLGPVETEIQLETDR
jgi:phospholipid/cholesterol/gamma-HCH transport system substrate-binding protein